MFKSYKLGKSENLKEPSHNRRIDLWITIAGLLGAILFFGLYDQAFPAAALDLKLSRSEISQLADETMAAYGYDISGYKTSLSFSESGMASIYLQRELGIPEANQRIREENLPIWFWSARYFIPLQKEEFLLRLAPDGGIVGFSHSIEEDQPGASLSQEEARELAEAYLIEQHGLDLQDWEEISASSEDKPGGRRDHFFSWKERNFKAGESELRVAVTVYGDRADGYDYWLKVPESFTREFAEQSSKADFMGTISQVIGMGGFTIAAIIFFILSLLRHGQPRRPGILMALLAGIVSLLAGLNSLPLYKSSYSTTQGYTQFWLEILFYGAIGLVIYVGYIFLIWSGGERISKLVWPRQDKALPLADDRWAELARSTWRGLMMAGILGGYVVLFYLVATRIFGGWTPMDIGYSDYLATPFPFLPAIVTGVLPAIEEETMFRLIGVSLILGLTRRRWLALLIPGALWAFAHTSYVRDPYYLRGIEILIPAIFLYGLFFLRFNLTTTIIGHMTYNATLGALPMLRSGEPYFIFSGLIVVLFLISPMLPGLWRAWRKRREGRGDEPGRPQITPATSQDLANLANLPVQGLDWEILLRNPDQIIYCLKANESILGCATGRLEGQTGWIEAVYVSKEQRERYWGSALIDAVCEALFRQGAQNIRFAAPPHNRRALAFLNGLGWRPVEQIFERSSWPAFPALKLTRQKDKSQGSQEA